MPTIRVLPPEVVNRIAAGEVVERPASVLKELVENSIDAGATEVTVELEDGGKKCIRVRDNGSGIAADDLPLVFRSHATSKLGEDSLAGDLFGVSTLGFRGEALASTGAVAMVDLVSRTHGAPHAHRIRAGSSEPEPAPGEEGTTIEVRNLFYNTPARQKFLRGTSTELAHAIQQLTRLALGFPGIRFRLAHGRKRLLDLPAAADLRARLTALLGEETAAELLPVEEGARGPRRGHGARPGTGVALMGFAGSPRLCRRDGREQHFFVNGRWIRDRMLTHSLRAAYEGFQIPGKQPVAYLFLDIPPGEVDVNVHPTKAEVRFREPSEVYRCVRAGVKRALERSASRPSEERQLLESLAEELDHGRGAAVALDRPAPWDAAPPAGAAGSWTAPGQAGAGARAPARTGVVYAGDFAGGAEEADGAGAAGPGASPARENGRPAGAELPAATAGGARRRFAGQVLDSFILVEAADGITLIDQHALHEKILFEEIHRRLRSGRLESQRLVVPEVVDLPAEVAPLLAAAAEKLAPFGFEVEPFGERAAAIRAFPALFDREAGRTEPREIVRAVLDCLREAELGADGPETGGLRSDVPETGGLGTDVPEACGAEAADPESGPDGAGGGGEGAAGGGGAREAPAAVARELRRLASTIACKRAVKAGTRLRPEEIEALLERGSLAEDPRYCPHGRPTTVFISRRDLEKQFDRK